MSDDAKGMSTSGGGREIGLTLKRVSTRCGMLLSNEIYAVMQTGVLDAAMTSSIIFGSCDLKEIAKRLTIEFDKTYWFMLELLMISKGLFTKLLKDQQDVVIAGGAELEVFARDVARANDKTAAGIYAKAGVKAYDMDEATLKNWQVIARETAWKDSGQKSGSCASLLKAAEKAAMSCGFDADPVAVGIDSDTLRRLPSLTCVLLRVSQALGTLGRIALLVASLVLTYIVSSHTM